MKRLFDMSLTDAACFAVGMSVGLVLLGVLMAELAARHSVRRICKGFA